MINDYINDSYNIDSAAVADSIIAGFDGDDHLMHAAAHHMISDAGTDLLELLQVLTIFLY
jgi:hypothetical protein